MKFCRSFRSLTPCPRSSKGLSSHLLGCRPRLDSNSSPIHSLFQAICLLKVGWTAKRNGEEEGSGRTFTA